MLTLILSLLGLGGVGGIGAALYFVGPAALLKLAKGVPWEIWAAVLVVALLTLGYCRAEKAGETRGAAKVEAKHEKAHAVAVAEARQDERAAQDTTDRIGERTVRMDDDTTTYLRSQLEELHHEIDAAHAATADAAAVPVDTRRVSASLDALVDRANGAASTADAGPEDHAD